MPEAPTSIPKIFAIIFIYVVNGSPLPVGLVWHVVPFLFEPTLLFVFGRLRQM
jgi:hypothetical protein